MNILSVVWFTSAIGGALVALAGLLVPKARRWTYFVAGVAFSIAGILGILSIGIFFLGLAALCFIGAAKAAAESSSPPPPSNRLKD